MGDTPETFMLHFPVRSSCHVPQTRQMSAASALVQSWNPERLGRLIWSTRGDFEARQASSHTLESRGRPQSFVGTESLRRMPASWRDWGDVNERTASGMAHHPPLRRSCANGVALSDMCNVGLSVGLKHFFPKHVDLAV